MIREIAQIDEARCIGCARCLPPCPFDAILGAHRYMHTVLAEFCTGCELCVAPCPVDCIVMVPRDSIPDAPPAPSAQMNRKRLQARDARLDHQTREKAALLAVKKRAAHPPSSH